MSKVTIRHVAERAGVSTSTVSRTLHNHPRISNETKQRVMDAVHALNYRSYLVAADESVQALGVVLPNSASELFSHPFFVQVLRGISVYAQEHGYFTTYAFAREEERKLEFLRRYVASGSTHGLILLSVFQHDPAVEYLLREEVPFAVIGRPEHPAQVLWVDNDNFHAMYDVVNRLIEGGARRIAFVGGPARMNVTRDRLEGYRMALANRGIELVSESVSYAPEFTESGGYRAMAAVLAWSVPDAFVATDDLLALGALKALADRGIEHVPCVGFNNSRAARDHTPGLSSVEIRPDELGRHAARLVIERIESGEVNENHFIVPTHYVERASTTQ